MKISRRLLCLTILVIAISAFYIFYSTSIFLRFSAVNFPLEKLWSQNLNGTVVDISTSSGNSVIFVRTDSFLFAIQPVDGKIIWSFPLTKQVYHSPARSAANAVFVTDNNSIQALSITDGKLAWKQPLPQSSGRLVDVSESLILVNQASYDIRAYDTQSGKLLWSVPAGRGFVPAYINNDVVYIADHGISAVKATTGESVWQHGNNVIGASTYNDGIIYYTSGNKITAFNTQARTESWNVNLPDNGLRRFKLDNEILFVMDEANLYQFNKSDGTLVWQANISHPANPVVIVDNTYVLEAFSRKIRVFDSAKTEISHMRISAPYLLVADKQDMFSSKDILLFSVGHYIFAYE